MVNVSKCSMVLNDCNHDLFYFNIDNIYDPDSATKANMNDSLMRVFRYIRTMKNADIFFSEIRNGNYEAVQKMLFVNIELVNAKDQRGSTTLILAAYYDQSEIVELLLENGAKIDEKDTSGNTALMGVCFRGFAEIAKKLIVKGANVNERNSMGGTALIYAITFNHSEIAKLLLANEADAFVKDGRGSTALDHAKMQGVPELIDLFEK